MEDTRDDTGSPEQRPPSPAWWPSDFVEKISLNNPREETLMHKLSTQNDESYQTASQILWSTGMLSERIPNGFYSVIPDKRLKERFEDIPSLDELQALGLEGLRADIIFVNAEKDKKLSMWKQLIIALAKGLTSNPATMIKKIAGLVADVYKRQNSDLSPARVPQEDTCHRGIQLLGHIKHGSCRPRAILFKVLADTVGLQSRLMVGLPTEGASECIDSYKHMSVLVILNSVEFLVDLMRFPGQLIPRSTKAIFMTHISAEESDSAENDSCDSPLEPNSPLFAFSDKPDPESAEKDDGLQYQRGSSNASGPSLRNMMLRSSTMVDRKVSLSHSEPDIATTFWQKSRRKVINEPKTANSSPEHLSLRARTRSILSGDNKSPRDCSDDIATTSTSYRSEGASTSEPRRLRRRSISITPEIGDDIVRAVRAMNETLKQNRLPREGNNILNRNSPLDHQNNAFEESALSIRMKEHMSSQRALSLPTSPREYISHTPDKTETSEFKSNEELVNTWNRVLESLKFQNQPLLPFEEWNIDFSELNVGTRVGIGFFGEVFRGIWNGTAVAIKVFLEQDLTAENMEDFCNEITILSRLRHPNVILFLGACTKPPRLSMVTEYMEMGSLYHLIHLSGQKKKITWRRRLKMLRDICRGLMCLHRMKIVHRDLKSANCLVNKHWTVKICDFGLSRIMTNMPFRDIVSAGTPEWMAPELIRNEPFTEKCDIFSLGVIMWELCTLGRPWEGVPPERVVYAVANERSRLEIPEGPLGRLISDCWAEADERPNCEEILTRLLDCEYSLC